MAPKKNSKKLIEAPIHRFDIPYLADDPLDPTYFPASVGSPVGGPPHRTEEQADLENGDWEDSDNEMEDETLTPGSNSTGTRRRRTSSGVGVAPEAKRIRVPGGRPAVPKKVTADLDSDDEIIVRMKEARYREKDIADRLKEEGRISYNSKTIGTRWVRIRRVLQQRQDELMDAQLADWHNGDDAALYNAITVVDEHIRKVKENAEAQKWRLVADKLKEIKPVTNFSQNACRDRYQALRAGTAKPTPESILNPGAEIIVKIEARQAREAEILQDGSTGTFGNLETDNLKLNAWTSRMRSRVPGEPTL